MTGTVDDAGRALLRVRLRNPLTGVDSELEAWVDTAFTGEVVLPKTQISALGLPVGSAVTAGLADGTLVELDTHTCLLEWFGQWKSVEVVVNQGQFPLLGVALLLKCRLNVDYPGKVLSVN